VFHGRGLSGTAFAVLALFVLASPAFADSMNEALESAYENNADFNAARAQVRGIDENVPQALAGYRPVVTGSADAGIERSRSKSAFGIGSSTSYPRGVAISVDQPLFLGFRTTNSVKQAKNAVRAAREQLRGVEQDTLLAAVRAFMSVVQAQVVLNLRTQNIEFLREQVRAATDRLNVGEGTRTDVAQTNARLSAGQSDYNAAAAAVNSALAVYEQVIGHRPKSLGAADHVDRRLPKTLDEAIARGLAEHPSILAATFTIDVASYNVKVLEGALLPSVTLSGDLSHRDDSGGSGTWSDTASLVGRLSVPIYEGGRDSSQVRQAKETLGQRRLELDSARAEVRQLVISAWGTLDAAKAQVEAAAAQVAAEELVLSGITEERKVGQRTTLDVLNAQQELLNARVTQVQAQHDRVVAAYALLAAVGGLSAQTLGLRVAIYDPTDHYVKVEDKWGGLRTPDGR
jgi:outer membrane protein